MYSDMNAGNYGNMGLDQTKEEAELAELECCLPGAFMSCSRGYWPRFGTCPDLMAKRCSKKWGVECDEYLGNLGEDEGKSFLNKTASLKYCRPDPNNNPLFKCHKRPELSNPLNPDSPVVSNWVGQQNYYVAGPDDRTSFGCPALSPTYELPCSSNKVCDVVSGTDLTFADPLYQRCVTWGACKEVLAAVPSQSRHEVNAMNEKILRKMNNRESKMTKEAQKKMDEAHKKMMDKYHKESVKRAKAHMKEVTVAKKIMKNGPPPPQTRWPQARGYYQGGGCGGY